MANGGERPAYSLILKRSSKEGVPRKTLYLHIGNAQRAPLVPSEEERRRIFGRTKGHCAYCKQKLDFDEDWDKAHIVSRKTLEGLGLKWLAEKLPIHLPAHYDCNQQITKRFSASPKRRKRFFVVREPRSHMTGRSIHGNSLIPRGSTGNKNPSADAQLMEVEDSWQKREYQSAWLGRLLVSRS